VQILGLSQPRITQYINSLESVGVIERLKEGSWVFSRLRRGNVAVSAILATALNALPSDDAVLKSDLRRLDDVRRERALAADAFFANVANDRGQLGDEYLPQSDIEARMRVIAGQGPFEMMVDLGTGTGRVLAVFALGFADDDIRAWGQSAGLICEQIEVVAAGDKSRPNVKIWQLKKHASASNNEASA